MTQERGKILVSIDDLGIERLPSVIRRYDIMDRNTIVDFIYSPQSCSVLCDRVLASKTPVLGSENLRPFVCYTPVIGCGNDGGWDSDICYTTPLLSRKSQDDPFVTWGVTETIEQEQLRRLKAVSHLALPSFVQISAIGLIEELAIDPCDVRVAYPTRNTTPHHGK